MVLDMLLGLPPLVTVGSVSFVISVLITVAYKLMTDQEHTKQLKDELKTHQKKMKEHKGSPDKALSSQKQALDIQMKLMKEQFKPTLITFLPIILVFSWLGGHYSHQAILPGEVVNVTVFFDEGRYGEVTLNAPDGIEIMGSSVAPITNSQASFIVRGEKIGTYFLEFVYDGISYNKEFQVNNIQKYSKVVQSDYSPPVDRITIGAKPLKLLNIGGFKLGYILTYILFSVVFSLAVRKLMRVH